MPVEPVPGTQPSITGCSHGFGETRAFLSSFDAERKVKVRQCQTAKCFCFVIRQDSGLLSFGSFDLVKDSSTRFAVLDFTFNCEEGGRFFFAYEERFVDLQVRNRTTITRSTSIIDRRQVALCLRMGIH